MCRDKIYSLAGVVFFLTLMMLIVWSKELQAQQKYPTKPIDMIIAYSPGGSADMTARMTAEFLRKKWGVPVNPINKTGGLAVPACLEVYNAKPDGYTMLGGDSMGTVSLLLVSVPNLPFKVMDRTFIGITLANPYIFTVPFASPINSMKDLEAEIKKDPHNFTWASIGGVGGPDHGARKFMKAIGVDPSNTRPVICKGGSEAARLTASGATKLGVVTPSSGGAVIDAKLVRPLAVTPNKRLERYPNLPTVAEAGYPSVSYQELIGTSGPPNLPTYIVEIWEKALEEMSKDHETLSKIHRLGLTPFYLNAQETRNARRKEIEEAKEMYGIK